MVPSALPLWDNGLTKTCMCHQSHLTSNHIGAITPSTNIYWIPKNQFNYTNMPEFEGLVRRFGAPPNVLQYIQDTFQVALQFG